MAPAIVEVLRKGPWDISVMFVITFLESFVIFNIYGILMWILREDCGFSDTVSGVLFGVFSICVGVYGALMGPVVDYIKVRKAMLFEILCCIAGQAIMSATLHPVAVCVALFLPMALGISGIHTIVAVAIQRYVRESHRTTVFTTRYAIMNIGAVPSLFLVDYVRLHVSISFMPLWSFFLACNTALQLVVLVITFLGVHDIEVTDDDDGNDDDRWQTQVVGNTTKSTGELKKQVKDVLNSANFWNLVLLSWVLVGAASILMYDHSLYPLYMKRAPFPVEHPENTEFMMMLALDPAIVVVMCFIVGEVITRFAMDRFWVIFVGSIINGVSPLFMIPTQYWGVFVYITTMAVGEGIWSPVYDKYVCEFTTKGSEGTFFGLAALTTVASRFIMGFASGFLLNIFCPAQGQCIEGWWIWLIAALGGVVTPLGMLATQRCTHIKPKETYIELEEVPEGTTIDQEEDEDHQ